VRLDMKRLNGDRGNLKAKEQRRRYLGYFELWEDYIQRIDQGVAGLKSLHRIRTEHLLDDPAQEIKRLASALGMKRQIADGTLRTLIDRNRKGSYMQSELLWLAEETPASAP
jgi:hypothetical protein